MAKVIWLVNPYGPLPSESWRTYCFAIMGKVLSEAGYEVVWWTSSFSHHFKTQRCDDWVDVDVQRSFIIRLVPTPGYKSNIGFGRVWRDIVFAHKVHSRGSKMPKPDLVIYSESPLNFGIGGYTVARKHGVPVVFHQMDLWPELIVDALPRVLKAFSQFIFFPVYFFRRRIYQKLDGIMALAKPYLDVPMRLAPILNNKPSALIYNGIDVQHFRASMADSVLPKQLPTKSANEIWAIFAGSLGPSYDIPTLLDAARMLASKKSSIRILIAGDGPYRKDVEIAVNALGASNLSYLGKIPTDILAAIYSRCDVGLCAYTESSNVEMPDKIYDYTAAGLAVINSLRGEVRLVIESRAIGLQYIAGNADHLVEQLVTLKQTPILLSKMKNSSFMVGSEYDQRLQYAKVVKFVKELI